MKSHEEWFNQADYDIETAEYMLKGGRYIYAVFMAHLAIEKLFKGLYTFYLNTIPPKTHNLILLQERIEQKVKLNLTKRQDEIIELLNEKSIPTRYPDILNKILQEYKESETVELVTIIKEIILCLKQQLMK